MVSHLRGLGLVIKPRMHTTRQNHIQSPLGKSDGMGQQTLASRDERNIGLVVVGLKYWGSNYMRLV